MSELDTIRSVVNGLRPELERRYPIRLIGIFGSAARGEARKASDIDILVDSKPGLSLFKVGAVKLRLEDALGRTVDIVFERSLGGRVKSRVMADLRPL